MAKVFENGHEALVFEGAARPIESMNDIGEIRDQLRLIWKARQCGRHCDG